MPANRLFKRSMIVAAATAMIVAPLLPASAQEDVPLTEEVLAANADEASAGAQDLGGAYLEAQRLLRADQRDAARSALEPVLSGGDETWQLIGRSSIALLDGDIDGARAQAQQAVERSGDSPWTQYQLGLVASRQDDWELAANSFERATQLNGDLAYAHYYAGLAFQKQRNSAKAAEHLGMFLKLAPDAPEREAVRAIVRTLG